MKAEIKPGQKINGTYRQLDDSPFLAADDFDCDGKPVSLEITNATAETVTAPTGQVKVMACLHFKGTNKLLAVNRTNARMITGLFGTNKPAEWIGQTVQLYRTTVQAFGNKNTAAIRVMGRGGG